MTGKFELNFGELDLLGVLDAAIDVIQPEADARGVRLEFTRPAQSIRLTGDDARLQQVFWNLLSNAIKFTPREGHVTITVAAAPGGVRVQISDDGQRISSEFLPHVFDRFAQAANGSGHSQKRLGLGLSLVREMIQAHGGSVVAESAGDGRGSTFTVTLPSTPAERASTAAIAALLNA